jgi:xanthine phosphoribosyltransferase
MKELRERILKEGKHLGGGILKVDSFLNHQVDASLMVKCGRCLAEFFGPLKPEKVLTAEISGIAPALMTATMLGIPVIYARKQKPITMANDVYLTSAPSHTKGLEISLMVSRDFLKKGEKVLIIDDFLASGETIMALARIVNAAEADLVGVGAIIEKTFENGRKRLEPLGVPVYTLARIRAMNGDKIEMEVS